MVWASEKGMYNPVRRQEDLVCILDALCMRDDDVLASSEGALLTEFVDSQAHKLNRGEFLVFMKDLYSRIETLLNGWVPSTQSPSLKSGDCCLLCHADAFWPSFLSITHHFGLRSVGTTEKGVETHRPFAQNETVVFLGRLTALWTGQWWEEPNAGSVESCATTRRCERTCMVRVCPGLI